MLTYNVTVKLVGGKNKRLSGVEQFYPKGYFINFEDDQKRVVQYSIRDVKSFTVTPVIRNPNPKAV